MQVIPYLAFTPYSSRLIKGQEYCAEIWPYEIFYVDNFLNKAKEQNCIDWVWYLACDLQYYLISPFLLYLYYHKPKWGIYLILLLIIISFVIQIALSVHYKLSSSVLKFDTKYISYYYYRPYNRCNPYFIGLLTGILYTNWINREQNIGYKICKYIYERMWIRISMYILGFNMFFWMIQIIP